MEEYKMCLKWKDMRGADIWTCLPCESANESLDRRVKEVNSKVEEVKKDLKVLGDRQEQVEVREQLRDSKFDSQAAELAVLKDRMSKLEANSGNSVFREIDERKIRESNIVIHQLQETEGDTAMERREGDEFKVQELLDTLSVKLTVKYDVKFSRRQGKPNDQQEVSRPLLVGFRYQQDQELVLANCWRLAKDKKFCKVSVGRDLTDKERSRERDLMVDAKAKNLNRSTEEQAKNLVFKVVGERGRRREILVPLRLGEVLDPEGRVVESEHRVGGGRSSWARHHHGTIPSSSANLEPLGQRAGRTRPPVQHSVGEEGNTIISQEEACNISTSSRVSDLVVQLERKREQQQAIGGGRGGGSMGKGEGVVEGQTNWEWEVVDNSQRGFKSKRGDRSLSASPTLVKKGRNGPLMDWAGRMVGEQE